MHAHIQRFSDVASRILRDLYGRFPDTTYPTPHSIGLTEEASQLERGRQVVSDNWVSISEEIRLALHWMELEGLVTRHSGPAFLITSKGFKALARLDSQCEAPSIC